jgi:endo-1,4-beta-D-glucanase Y
VRRSFLLLGPVCVFFVTAGCGNDAPGSARGSTNPSSGAGGSGNAGLGGASFGNGGTGATAGQTPSRGGAAGTAVMPPAAGMSGVAGTNGGGTGAAGAASGGSAGALGGQGGSGPVAGTSAGGAPTAGSAGSGGAMPSAWHAAVASAVTSDLLKTEYANWKTKHVQTCTNGSAVVTKDGGAVVSEGIGYGMLLAVGFDDRSLFDGLWKYYGDHLDAQGLMNWSTGVCDAPGNNNANAATDGDLDTAMALVQASARWPDGDYLTQAKTLAASIIAHETELCDGRAILRPGDMFGGCSDMGNARVNPSYFAPGYYRVFAAKFADQAERWNALVTGSYDLYPLYQARMSGLVPDWAAVDGSDWYGSGYSYDACRTPWRVMVDYAWSGDDRARTVLEGVRGWVDKNALGSVPNNSAFTGSFALAAAYDATKFDAAVASWLAANGDDTPYFQGTLRVLFLLAAAGQFPSTL